MSKSRFYRLCFWLTLGLLALFAGHAIWQKITEGEMMPGSMLRIGSFLFLTLLSFTLWKMAKKVEELDNNLSK